MAMYCNDETQYMGEGRYILREKIMHVQRTSIFKVQLVLTKKKPVLN